MAQGGIFITEELVQLMMEDLGNAQKQKDTQRVLSTFGLVALVLVEESHWRILFLDICCYTSASVVVSHSNFMDCIWHHIRAILM